MPGDDPLGLGQQVLLAVEESDALVLVVDGREGDTGREGVIGCDHRQVRGAVCHTGLACT